MVSIEANKAAIIVVDMWDTHYCKLLNVHIDSLASRIDRALKHFRGYNIPVIFMSEDILPTYKNTRGATELSGYSRNRETWEPIEHPPAPGHETWWNWCHVCEHAPCDHGHAWTHIHANINVNKKDLIGGWAQHIGFIREYDIDTLLYCGMASNICMLANRNFSICQSIAGGMNCIFMIDLSVGLVPEVSYREGHDMVVKYYQENICPVAMWRGVKIEGCGVWDYES